MITPNDFRNGTTFKRGNDIFRVVEFLHVKPGKGPAFMRAKIQNLRSGGIVELTMRTEEKLEDIRVERREMTFLYRQGEDFVFMDNADFDQVIVPPEAVGDKAKLIKENDIVFIEKYEYEILGVDLPAAVVLRVVQTEPGVRGDTATAASKRATLETGAVIQVPLFVEEGTLIKVDTRTFSYLERVKESS
jgi:elongation factor P